jgi:hypothetical protein
MQQNLNAYDPNVFEEYFTKTDLYARLKQDFDICRFGRDHLKIRDNMTARQFVTQRQFSVIPFYYLKFLTDQNPTEIYDLGCGWNIFKRYIPNIIGIGEESLDSGRFYGDMSGKVDNDFLATHQNYFESVFAINSLHFHPLSTIRKIVLDFISMIAPNGHGFLTLNLMRMFERDLEKFQKYTKIELENFVRAELSFVNAEYLVFDVDFDDPEWGMDNGMDGNIRLVCRKIT